MLTYQLDKSKGPMYQQLYEAIKSDIISGKLEKDFKLPSKRTLARNYSLSTITIQNAYDQLISEGYITAIEKKGYYVAGNKNIKKPLLIYKASESKPYYDNLSNTNISVANFPFSVWSRLMRRIIGQDSLKLLAPIQAAGMDELRCAIAKHLYSFRSMVVNPEQIIIGAGTEYLYSLVIQLLGRDKHFAIEDPGYDKLAKIYSANNVEYSLVELDNEGLNVDKLNKTQRFKNLCAKP